MKSQFEKEKFLVIRRLRSSLTLYSESWSHWKILIQDKTGKEKEADPNLYTRLGRVKISFNNEVFTISSIINSIFNKTNVNEDRKIKAKLIHVLITKGKVFVIQG